jgi:hypothetical protein
MDWTLPVVDTTYSAQPEIVFRFLVPQPVDEVLLYDGDADLADDTDDPNSVSEACREIPVFFEYPDEDPDGDPSNGPWLNWRDPNLWEPDCPGFPTSPITLAEGENPGDPPDDNPFDPPGNDDILVTQSPNVMYTVHSPAEDFQGRPLPRREWSNTDVSGDQEWERWILGPPTGCNTDVCDTQSDPAWHAQMEAMYPYPESEYGQKLPSGTWKWVFDGLDGFNTMFIHADYDVFPEPARLGNTVWYDTNMNGFWDGPDGPDGVPGTPDDEPGINGVKLNLYRDLNQNQVIDAGDYKLDPSQYTDTTLGGIPGQYLFDDLSPGHYLVEVDPSNFDCATGGLLCDLIQTVDRSGEVDDHHNRRDPWPVFLPTNISYVNADFGYYENPPECEVEIDKKCVVPEPDPDPGDFACEKPLDELTMIWDGTGTVRIKAWKDVPGDLLLADIDNIAVGDEVTVSGYAPKDDTDVIWEIFVAGTDNKIGESTFHMSCSDDDMDGETDDPAFPNDCGKNEGDGKGQSGYINDWLLEGMVDSKGTLDCTP